MSDDILLVGVQTWTPLPNGSEEFMTMRALLFVPFVVAVLSAGSPDKGSFTSGVWHGKAN